MRSAARREPRDERRLALVRDPAAPARPRPDSPRRHVAGGVALILSLGASIGAAAVLTTLAYAW